MMIGVKGSTLYALAVLCKVWNTRCVEVSSDGASVIPSRAGAGTDILQTLFHVLLSRSNLLISNMRSREENAEFNRV